MNKRYRMPDRWKERQAQEMKRRFASYLGEPPAAHAKRTNRLLAAVVVACCLAVWLFVRR